MRHGCHECHRENAIAMTGPGQDFAECDFCHRVWSVEWVKLPVPAHKRFRMPKMTLVDDGQDHWQSLGAASMPVIEQARKAKAA